MRRFDMKELVYTVFDSFRITAENADSVLVSLLYVFGVIFTSEELEWFRLYFCEVYLEVLEGDMVDDEGIW